MMQNCHFQMSVLQTELPQFRPLQAPAAGAFILRQNTNTTEFMEITGNGGENE